MSPPVNANTADRDGTPIDVLLHVRDGFLHELEIYRVDNGNVVALPAPEGWELFLPYPGSE